MSVEFDWNELLMELLYGKIINIIKESDGIHIFNKGNSVFFLCNNKLYAFGKKHDCIDSEGDTVVPIEVQNLENVGIESLCTGDSHAALLDRNGSVFCWGNNSYGQIGCDMSDVQLMRKPYKLSLSKVVQISCGGNYTLALNNENEVWFWGYMTSTVVCAPIKVNLPSNIKCISAGNRHAAVLSHDGKVFTWGVSRRGPDVSEPKEIELAEKVQNVIALYEYTFLITSNNELYYSYGTMTEIYSFNICDHKCGEITSLVGCYYSEGVAVINSEDVVYSKSSIYFSSFEQFNDTIYKLFQETPSLKSIDHQLCHKGTGIMPLIIKNKDCYINVSKFFNNNHYSDITLKLTNDLIYAHKIILTKKSDYFKKLFEDDTEGTLKEIDVSNFNSQSYKGFIKYLYTASLDIEIEQLPELYLLAEQHGTEELKSFCLKMWLNGMNRDNIVQLYHVAYLEKVEPLMNACGSLLFHYLDDIQRTEEFNELSINEKYSLVTAGALYNKK